MGKRACVLLGIALCLQSAAAMAQELPGGISAFSIEAETGLVLLEHNADVVRAPASMVKIMLMLLVVEGLERGDWTLQTPIEASRHAQRMGGTQVYLHEGEVHPLEALMIAVAVASANDAAMAVAEGLWGSEEAYLANVNERARELGMDSSEFHSVHGLPPDRGEEPDKTTARDMATLARTCVRHPQILEWTNTVSFELRPAEGKKYTTNTLMRQMPECDGLKTGYIRSAGFCITATAEREGLRIISVVMGYNDNRARFDLAGRLLQEGLDDVRKERVVIRGVTPAPTVRVANSETKAVALEFSDDLWVTVRRSDWDRILVVLDHPEEMRAPME
ncbi:MAG: D-alanyl-D-alanine carboxypeptidase, partial [Candidatus Hydrogenedentes bacterium]|nr:D-alanyl-D-alanine carboxypeptidase [Candidatus Hydrogenedentota bacterium]